MKKVFLLIVVLFSVGFAFNSFAQKIENPGTWFKTGSVLTYHVLNVTKEYDYIVSDLVVDNNIAFNWKMTEPVNYSGSVKIYNNAIDTASIMVNYFQNGNTQNMVNKTTAMISRKLYKRLLQHIPVDITVDKSFESLKFIRDEKYPVTIDGNQQEISVMVAETETGHKFWILNNPQFPLIIKMELDFTIDLRSVTTTK